MNLLEVENLRVSFSIYGKELQAVRGISFEVGPGEAVGIVGESGCGKSAAVQSILRLTPASKIEGAIRFEGEELLEKSEKEMKEKRTKKKRETTKINNLKKKISIARRLFCRRLWKVV